MKKKEAKELFGSSEALCEAVGISLDTLYRWPQVLDQSRADRVRGAYMRTHTERSEKAQAILDGSFVRSYTGKPVK